MTAKYLAILTNQGAARLANAAALGTQLNLTQMGVGDANGTLPTPDPAQTALINQRRIKPLNMLTVDPANPSQIIAEQIIPENEGGFWIREIGLYDEDGILIAVANCPETYKPQLQEGSGRTQTIRMILIVSSTSAITLKIDPAVVLATRQYVDDGVIEVKAYADSLLAAHLDDADPHQQYLRAEEMAVLPGLPLIGVPFPWPLEKLPGEIFPELNSWGVVFLKGNGAVFDPVKYPRLAKVYPSGSLPDMRGEFIRGWDDGRGVDSGRAILSSQTDAMQKMTGAIKGIVHFSNNQGSGVFDAADTGNSVSLTQQAQGNAVTDHNFDSSRVVRSATETRPRNVAFNYIVRAA